MSNIDPYYYIFNGIGYPNHYEKVELPAGFKVYLLCNGTEERHVFVYTDRAEFDLSSKRDAEDVYRLFVNLSNRLVECDKANDLFEYYDSSELHEAARVKIEVSDVPVYRIRKASLRLYMVFLGSDIVLFRLATKRQDKISKSEQKVLENRVKAIFLYPAGSKDFLRRVL